MIINNVNSFIHKTDGIIKNDKSKDTSFKSFLDDAIGYVDNLQKQSDKSITLLAAGKIDNIHQVMVDSGKADVALQLTIQIRNKIVDAYNEIMRMNL